MIRPSRGKPSLAGSGRRRENRRALFVSLGRFWYHTVAPNFGSYRGVAMFRVRSVLYPTDFSSHSNHAYLHAVALAENLGARMTIAYVATPDQLSRRDFWRGQLEQIRPANRSIPVDHVFLEGDPASELVRYAGETDTDLIVMGTHGRTGVERLLMGSVAEQVMRGAPCSVMCVKLPKGHRETDRPLILTDQSS